MVDIGLAAKKTMARHAPIKLLLKSPLLPRFHSVSFCLVSGQDLQVSGCDIRDSMLSTPNRLHKDRRQKDSNTACAFICLDKKGGREGKGLRGWREREKKREWKRESEIVISGYGYLWTQEQREEKNPERKRRKRGEKKGELFTLSGYRWARPASLFYQEKMLIINLRLHATSLFNSW